MHPIIEAGIMKTRTRPRRTAGRTRLVWRGLPDRPPGAAAAAHRALTRCGTRPARMMKPFRAVRVSWDAAGTRHRARRHGPCAQGAGKSSGGRRQ